MVLTQISTSLSEFQIDPTLMLHKAKGQPFAVMKNKKVLFYVLSADLYEQILEQIWDHANSAELLRRSADRIDAVRVNIEDL